MRRPIVFQGITYPDYEIDFYTSNVYGKRFKDRALKPRENEHGYLFFTLRVESRVATTKQHRLLAETFPDLLSKSPLVSHYDLKIGNDRHELKTPTGFTFLCNQVCPDHIDSNRTNNHHTNLMLVTQHENNLKCKPIKGKKYKGGYKTKDGGYDIQICWENILDKNGKPLRISKFFKIEEEAALTYNTILEKALLTVWGPDLGPKMYDLAYKNVIEK